MHTMIVKWGNSRGVRLPKHLLDSVNLSDNDPIEIIAKDDSIIIKKAKTEKPYKTIEELFAGFDGEYEPVEINWSPPVGNEIW